jgi:hypothetical protein
VRIWRSRRHVHFSSGHMTWNRSKLEILEVGRSSRNTTLRIQCGARIKHATNSIHGAKPVDMYRILQDSPYRHESMQLSFRVSYASCCTLIPLVFVEPDDFAVPRCDAWGNQNPKCLLSASKDTRPLGVPVGPTRICATALCSALSWRS